MNEELKIPFNAKDIVDAYKIAKPFFDKINAGYSSHWRPSRTSEDLGKGMTPQSNQIANDTAILIQSAIDFKIKNDKILAEDLMDSIEEMILQVNEKIKLPFYIIESLYHWGYKETARLFGHKKYQLIMNTNGIIERENEIKRLKDQKFVSADDVGQIKAHEENIKVMKKSLKLINGN